MRKALLLFAAFALSICAWAQWPSSTDKAVQISLPGQSDYGCQTAFSPDGVTYVVKIVPQRPGEAGLTVLSYRLYALDKDGVLLSPAEGYDIATENNKSWTAVNSQLYVDKDGNAIVMCCDSRNAREYSDEQGYTIYKVNPKGEVIWTADLDKGNVYYLPVSINCVEDTDGNYLFAYTPYTTIEANAVPPLLLEKLDKNTGATIWTRKMEHETRPYAYPHLVASNNNQSLLFYLYTSNQYVYAKMLDKDGNDVWDSDARVYRGGFGSIPAHVTIKSFEGPDGGGLFTWRDDRNYEDVYASYASYIKADGSYGFPGETDALKVCYDDFQSRNSADIAWSEQHNCFYAALQIFNQAYQNYQGLYVQKISKEGELLWGPNGLALEPLEEQSIYNDPIVRIDNEGNPVVFYMKTTDIYTYQTNDIQQCAVKLDKDGNKLFSEEVTFDTHKSYKTSLAVSQLIDNKYWVVAWSDNRFGEMDYGSNNMMATRFNVDGTIGDPESGIHAIEAGATSDDAYFDLSGRRVSQPSKGIYIRNGCKTVVR